MGGTGAPGKRHYLGEDMDIWETEFMPTNSNVNFLQIRKNANKLFADLYEKPPRALTKGRSGGDLNGFQRPSEDISIPQPNSRSAIAFTLCKPYYPAGNPGSAPEYKG